MPRRSRATLAGLAALALAAAGCGQKGAPLAPLHLVPAAVKDIALRRVGDRAELKFVLPTSNANGPGRVDLDRVEIYAVTVAPGAPAPPNRELLTPTYLVGRVDVRPPLQEGESAAEGEKRPEPGAAVTFEEELTAQKLTPIISKPEKGTEKAKPAVQLPFPDPQFAILMPGVPMPPPPPPPPKDPLRIYVMRGVTRSGRPGPPSARVQFPLIPLPSPPTEIAMKFTESAVVVEWKPPAEKVASYNVYRSDAPMQPINASPVSETTIEHPVAKLGEEQCFRVRSIAVISGVAIEGEPSAEQCVTPVDTFPPAAPKGLAGVPTPGQISLIWDANTEKDLAGYVVLRGEAPNGPLEPLTKAPIQKASYRDDTVKPGVRYVYVVVAVDTATPPNTSAQSARVEETAR